MKKIKMRAPNAKLIGNRIYLEKLKMSRAQIIFEYINKDRKRLQRFLPWVPWIKYIRDETKYIKRTQADWKEFKVFNFAIIRKSDGMYMGNIGIHSIKWFHKVCEIGYWILGDFEGQGYISEAVKVIEKEMFRLGFNRVQIRCRSYNKRSARVPKRCGYKYEGRLREDTVEAGQFRDTLVFSKLKREL